MPLRIDETEHVSTVSHVAHLVANTSWEEAHELGRLVALNLPVLHWMPTQKVIQLDGQHCTRPLLVP